MTATDQPKTGWGVMRTTLTVAGTVVALVAGVVTTVLALQDRPAARTLDDWAREASAVCDTSRGDLTQRFRTAQDAIGDAYDPSAGMDVEAAARGVEDAADISRELVGKLRGLELPARGGDTIEDVLSQADTLDALYADMAYLARQMDPFEPDAEPLLSEMTRLTEQIMALREEFADGLRSLGAKSCAMS